jgi:tetratricopeptide (TPR) repeat protein
MYICQNETCAIALAKAKFPAFIDCPVCQTPLIEAGEENGLMLTDEDAQLLRRLPYVIAYPLQQTLLEKNVPQRLNYFRDTFLNYLKYLGLLTASEFFNSSFKERKIVDLFMRNLAQPSFGSWNAFSRDCLQYLKTKNHTFFCPDLVAYYETIETGKKRKMYNGEKEIVDSYNGGAIEYIKQPETGIGMLINFRNRYLGHGLTLDTVTSEKLWEVYFPIFRTLLEPLTFCEKFPMLKQEAGVYYSLQGIEIKPFETNVVIDSNVLIYNTDATTSMPIIPFFIIPGELAIESDEKANIMSYESNNGKTITFFSPEGITKHTSGKLLERLNLLLRDKQKEIPFTPETFTKVLFAARIAEENELMLKSLIVEKKVIEGIYQHREEMEIKLREWIGARANIFFIAAEAGSGKTNLLVEMQKQYAARNLPSLFIRASRMKKSSLKETLCYQLNLDVTLDIGHYKALAGTQAEPTFILIDGLNESSNAESIWQEVLEISSAFAPGSLKFVISSRANTKTDLDRYVITEDQMQYLYGENKDHQTSLGAFAFWLTPLDMMEMEAAWGSYVAKDKTRFKPLFSFSDIATFDRGLYLQINNSLVLRIFMETYKGKKLPKKGSKHLNVWKDWFATFSAEEQNFMHLLAETVWEQGENELLLDTVLNSEKLQSYFLNDSIGAPYHRLLAMGWISRYVKDLTLYVSFTVEGLLLYLLGTQLNQKKPVLTKEAIGEILENGTALQKAAVEAFLCEQALEGNIELISQLIDEGEEKLALCVTPLLYFLKSHGVETTIEKLLENPTENDWKVLLELDKELNQLELHILRKQFLEVLMPLNPMISKNTVLFGLLSIIELEEDDAKFYFSKINMQLEFIKIDADLLSALGNCFSHFKYFDKAINYYNKSLDIYLKNLGEDNPEIANLYNEIGDALNNKGEYDKALLYYTKNLEMYLKHVGNEHPIKSIYYENIGIISERKGEYDEALKNYELSLKIRLKNFGNQHKSIASCYEFIGGVYIHKEDCIKAIEFYEKALNIRLKIYNDSSSQLLFYYKAIEGLCFINHFYEKAIEYSNKCLKIQMLTLKPDDIDLSETYNDLGKSFIRVGKNDKAIESLEKCVSIQIKKLGHLHKDVRTTYNNIISLWEGKGDLEKVLEIHLKILTLKTNDTDINYSDIATSYFRIGKIYKELSKYHNATEYLCLAYNTLKKGGIPFQIAQCYEALNDKENALDYYIQSAEIRKDDLGLEDENTKESISNSLRLSIELDKEKELPDWIKDLN